MMNLMIYFIINLSLNNCQNIFISYSSKDNSTQENRFYNEFHQSYNQIFKNKKKISENFTTLYNITINNTEYNAIFNKIPSFKDYKEKIIIFSPKPITININGDLYYNNTSNKFYFKKNIYFYSINEIDFQTNNITLEFNFKYKKIKRFKDLKLEKGLDLIHSFQILLILDDEIVPKITKDIEIQMKKGITSRYKNIFKTEYIPFELASFFGELSLYLKTEIDGFCQIFNNSDRIICPLKGIICKEKIDDDTSITKYENGKKAFIEDINLLDFKENENGIYVNYVIVEQIFHLIHYNFYTFTLSNSNKEPNLPYMNVYYLNQFFHNIASYYILSEEFYIIFQIINCQKLDKNNGSVYLSFHIYIHNDVIVNGILFANFSYLLYLETQKFKFQIDSFNITSVNIVQSVFRIKDKNYFIKKIKEDWIGVKKIKFPPLLQNGINFYKYILYIVKYEIGKNGFYIKGKKNKYIPLDIY